MHIASRRGLFPEIHPFRSGTLAVSDPHRIYFEECGNPQGKPVLMVHGGPGGGSDDSADVSASRSIKRAWWKNSSRTSSGGSPYHLRPR